MRWCWMGVSRNSAVGSSRATLWLGVSLSSGGGRILVFVMVWCFRAGTFSALSHFTTYNNNGSQSSLASVMKASCNIMRNKENFDLVNKYSTDNPFRNHMNEV